MLLHIPGNEGTAEPYESASTNADLRRRLVWIALSSQVSLIEREVGQWLRKKHSTSGSKTQVLRQNETTTGSCHTREFLSAACLANITEDSFTFPPNCVTRKRCQVDASCSDVSERYRGSRLRSSGNEFNAALRFPTRKISHNISHNLSRHGRSLRQELFLSQNGWTETAEIRRFSAVRSPRFWVSGYSTTRRIRSSIHSSSSRSLNIKT